MKPKHFFKPSYVISAMVPAIGFFSQVAVRFPMLGKEILALSNKGLGRLIPNLGFLGFRKEANYENAIWNWEIYLNLIGAEYEVENTFPDSRCYIFRKCPAGYCRLEHLNACKATMEIDHSLVESSGARLIVEKRFPTDGICIERIVKA